MRASRTATVAIARPCRPDRVRPPMSTSDPAAPEPATVPGAVSSAPVRRTPLHEQHVAAGGRMVDFAGWTLPIAYGSQLDEHRAVREAAGMFDVSHMTNVDVGGPDATAWLRGLLTGDVARLDRGRALYACLCDEAGGVIDDLIAYRMEDERYRVVVNAATREKDLAWLEAHRDEGVELEVLDDRVLLAVQGPKAVALARDALGELLPDIASLPRFGAVRGERAFVGRTGYTGEDGLEISLGADDGVAAWKALLAAGVVPCGLGARDTLRLEAGMCLYGQDLDEAHTPFESGIGWAVDLKDGARDFVGRAALAAQAEGGARFRRIGVLLEGRGIARAGYPVQVAGEAIGAVTSGGFSPTLGRSIALVRVTEGAEADACDVMVRGKPVAARRAKVPFVRDGRPNG